VARHAPQGGRMHHSSARLPTPLKPIRPGPGRFPPRPITSGAAVVSRTRDADDHRRAGCAGRGTVSPIGREARRTRACPSLIAWYDRDGAVGPRASGDDAEWRLRPAQPALRRAPFLLLTFARTAPNAARIGPASRGRRAIPRCAGSCPLHDLHTLERVGRRSAGRILTIIYPPPKLDYATPRPARAQGWEPEMGWPLFILAIALGWMMCMTLLLVTVTGWVG
jgi:hypothetical protein